MATKGTPMREEVKKFILEEWVPALRSGNYKQTSAALHEQRSDGSEAFCCLGVACDLLKDRLELVRTPVDRDEFALISYDGEPAALPRKAATFLQLWNEDTLDNDGPDVTNIKKYDQNVLMTWNDSGVSFDVIAAKLEEIANGQD